MNKAKENIIKGYVTSTIGVATMVITLVLLWKSSISFIWEGVGGLSIGAILLLAPKTIERKVSQVIDKYGGNSSSSCNPPEENNKKDHVQL